MPGIQIFGSGSGGSLPYLAANDIGGALKELAAGQVVEVGETSAASGPRTITYGAATEVLVPAFIAPFPLVVTGLRIVTPTAQAASDSNYWIVMLRRRRMSLPVNPYSAEVLADSPYEYWRLGEAVAAPNALSVGSNAQSLAYSGTPPTLGQASLVRRASDTSALFVRASSTNAKSAAGYTWDFSANAFVIEALIQTNILSTNANRQTIFGRPVTAFQPLIELGGSAGTGRASFLIPGAFQYETPSYTVLPGNVYHLAYRRSAWNGSAATQDWFVNGVKQAYGTSTPSANGCTSGSASTYIGSREAGGGAPATQFFDGYIDDVAVYMSALSDARIQAHASAGAPLAEIGRKTTQTVATGGEAITGWLPWTFDPVPIDSYASVCDKDDVVSVSFYPVGTPNTLTDVLLEVTYEAI
jgi:hypothetical protein